MSIDHIKNSRITLRTLLSLTILSSSLSLSIFYFLHTHTNDAVHLNESSFVLILTTSKIDLDACTPENKKICTVVPTEEDSLETTVKGSGFVVAQTRTHTYVVTAEHVCNFKIKKPKSLVPYVYKNMLVNEISLIEFNGTPHKAKIKYFDEKNDICLLETEGVWGKPTPIATKMPRHGEKVYNVAAPFGIFNPGMALVFDGYYSGTNMWGDEVFTLPARPGSSGSAIFNEDGELVSIIHSASLMMENLGLGCKLENLRNAIHPHIPRPPPPAYRPY